MDTGICIVSLTTSPLYSIYLVMSSTAADSSMLQHLTKDTCSTPVLHLSTRSSDCVRNIWPVFRPILYAVWCRFTCPVGISDITRNGSPNVSPNVSLSLSAYLVYSGVSLVCVSPYNQSFPHCFSKTVVRSGILGFADLSLASAHCCASMLVIVDTVSFGLLQHSRVYI